mgnify:CR=1
LDGFIKHDYTLVEDCEERGKLP